MPWINDENGKKKYIPSIYAKEELPTWNEVYNEFYRNRVYMYSHIDLNHLKRDPYWKIPHQKYLLAVVCNQLNKMIFEDDMKDDVIHYMQDILSDRVRYVAFVLETDNDHNPVIPDPSSPPAIYTIPLPTGEPNPFIIPSAVDRINIAEVKGTDLYLVPWIGYDVSGGFHVPELNMDHLDKLIDFMMRQMKSYFEGEGVGWKDSNGKLIESEPNLDYNHYAGVDPAL